MAEGRPNRNNDAMEGETNEEGSNMASLLIVILSLVFVVIFGYALIGGVVSGDPTNGFFITVIVTSAFAIVVSAGVFVRHMYTKRAGDVDNDQYLSKDNRGTFSGSDEENQQEGNENDVEDPDEDETLMEIQAKSVFGEMSALSPNSYSEDSLSTFHHHIIRNHRKKDRQGFDFSRITPADNTQRARPRQDPPEGVSASNFQAAWVTRGNSQDPSGPKLSSEGEVFDNDDEDNNDATSVADPDEIEEKSIKAPKSPLARLTSALRPKSPAHSVANSLPPSILKKKGKKTNAPKRPSSTRSVPVFKSFPNTPAASEAGSIASTFFGMFGNNKKAASEVGVSNTVELNVKKESKEVAETNEDSKKSTDTVVSNESKPPVKKPNGGKPPMVRPPMLPPSNKLGEEKMKRIGAMPSTPGDKSTFTIPPPRPIPRTPMGSEVYSEFQSVVGSTAASSTFDPVAHQKALDKLRESEAAIGARPAMPVYYNDEEDDEDVNDKDNVPPTPAGSALSYDVFAPPGALGIVVDTTEKGCIVYSLKKSSPMQGLMNKGDLIIGLDNFDVRNMDAASLTKLMAKKAQQAERKFTLMPTSS